MIGIDHKRQIAGAANAIGLAGAPRSGHDDEIGRA